MAGPEELTLAVVGIGYPNADGSNRRFEVALCRPGDAVELRREPRNRIDPRAVAVWRSGGGQLGYLSAERCGWVGQRLAREEALAIFQAADRGCAYIRVRFGGGPPSLPPSLTADVDDEVDAVRDDDGPLFGA